jgi:hypothetical protein
MPLGDSAQAGVDPTDPMAGRRSEAACPCSQWSTPSSAATRTVTRPGVASRGIDRGGDRTSCRGRWRRGQSDPIDAQLAALHALRLDADRLPTPRADGVTMRRYEFCSALAGNSPPPRCGRSIVCARCCSPADRALSRGALTPQPARRLLNNCVSVPAWWWLGRDA